MYVASFLVLSLRFSQTGVNWLLGELCLRQPRSIILCASDSCTRKPMPPHSLELSWLALTPTKLYASSIGVGGWKSAWRVSCMHRTPTLYMSIACVIPMSLLSSFAAVKPATLNVPTRVRGVVVVGG